MIGLVRIALRRPYTMAIAAMLIVLMGGLAVTRMVVDIFPNIDIPVVYVAWNYPGLSAEDMERRVVLVVGARLFDHRQRHRAHRIHLDPGAGHSQGLLPAGHRYRRRHRADLGAEQLDPAHRPAGDHAAEHDPVQRVERPGRAGDADQQDRARAGTVRLRLEFSPRQAVHHLRTVDSGPVRRQAAADHRRRRSHAPERQGIFADGRRRCPADDQRDRAGRHRTNWNARVQRPAQFEPATGRSVPVAPGRHPRRHPGAARRRGQDQRQLCHADQCRPHQWPALQLHGDPEELGCLDTDRRRRRPQHAAGAAGHRARRHRAEDGLRSVRLRARRGRERRARGDPLLDSRLVDDPGVPRQLAEHRDRVDVDPAVDRGGDGGTVPHRPDHQPDDARRPRARHRPPGRQRHRHHREHPPQPGAGKAPHDRDPRRVERGDPAADGRDAGDLHRVLPGAAADRAGALPVHPAGGDGRALDARILRAVVHGGARLCALPAQGP